MDDKKFNILSDEYTRLVVFSVETGEEIAVITSEEITTADNYAVKLRPRYD